MGSFHEDGQAYCAWKSRETGEEWRLPTGEEREKAARGVDGRRFPWRDLEHTSPGKCRDSRDEDRQPEPAGNVWDWTDSWYDARRSLRVLRGGSWLFGFARRRCGVRYGLAPRVRFTSVGFRCAGGL
jgi:serine/threonine-protein kinase